MSFGRRQGGGSGPALKAPPVRRKPRAPGDADTKVVAFANAGRSAANDGAAPSLAMLTAQVADAVLEAEEKPDFATMSRGEIAEFAGQAASSMLGDMFSDLNPLEQRNLVTGIVNKLYVPVAIEPDEASAPDEGAEASAAADVGRSLSSVEEARKKVQPVLVERIDVSTAITLPREELTLQVTDIISEILHEEKLQLNQAEQRDLVKIVLDEMLGLGPLEPLLADESVTDIMVNGPKQVYVERKGKLELSGVTFRDNRHVMNIASRIVSAVGRRVDETTPLVDARLADGSRVNIIIPPLAIDGPSISIRKFSKKKITLDTMEKQDNLSPQMAAVLRIASRSRLNILISGGTGSGKTTLLNAMSQMIDLGERIVTIEDAAELQLQQPHVVRLETRPANLEGQGAISMRELVKNALRMRPDRIILGEIRGAEAIDMLQAMNTGHEGSMSTIHANRPREALTRLENMVGMAGINLPPKAVRTQIADAVDIIVQVSRMRDGIRRITHIMEIVGMEGDVVTTQDLFTFNYEGEDPSGRLLGTFKSGGVRPAFAQKAEYFGLERPLLEAMRP